MYSRIYTSSENLANLGRGDVEIIGLTRIVYMYLKINKKQHIIARHIPAVQQPGRLNKSS